jgi:hypothetical protein
MKEVPTMQVFENDVTSQIGDNILEYSKNN